jgi:hypothetical protein
LTTSTHSAPQVDPKDPTNLGNVLHSMGALDEEAVRVAVQAKTASAWDKMPLGEVMVHLGLISSEDVTYALDVQQLMRAGKFGEAAVRIMQYQTRRMDRSLRSATPTAVEACRRLGLSEEALRELSAVA